MIDIKIKRLDERAVLPTKAHNTDAGFDMTAISLEFDEYGNAVYGFGWAFDIPVGYVGVLAPRSSATKYDVDMPNSLGMIDAGFHGEVKAKYRPTSTQPVRGTQTDSIEVCQSSRANIFKVGEKVAQMIIMKLPDVAFVETDELPQSERGEGGWGHTGR
jgi:dUTP pyrophosphatase